MSSSLKTYTSFPSFKRRKPVVVETLKKEILRSHSGVQNIVLVWSPRVSRSNAVAAATPEDTDTHAVAKRGSSGEIPRDHDPQSRLKMLATPRARDQSDKTDSRNWREKASKQRGLLSRSEARGFFVQPNGALAPATGDQF